MGRTLSARKDGESCVLALMEMRFVSEGCGALGIPVVRHGEEAASPVLAFSKLKCSGLL